MPRTTSHLTKTSLLCLSLLLGALNGEEGLDPEVPKECDSSWCCLDGIHFRATLFYLKPTIDQSSYVISSTNNRFGGEVYPNGKRHLIDPDYKPGFRLETLGEICNKATLLNLRFTAFNCHPCSTTKGPFLFDTTGYPGHGAQSPEDTTYAGRAVVKHNYQYYGADATINRYIMDWCPDNLTFLFGLHYTYLRFKQKNLSIGTYQTTTATPPVNNIFKQRSVFWGAGPQIGADYNYLFGVACCDGCFGLNANARAALLASSTTAKLSYLTSRTGPAGLNVKNDTLWRINPAFSAQIGLTYSYTCCELDAFIELGWEFIWYAKCVDKITSYDVAFAGDTLDILDDLSLQGPFLRCSICF